jgi:hypothetical protein
VLTNLTEVLRQVAPLGDDDRLTANSRAHDQRRPGRLQVLHQLVRGAGDVDAARGACRGQTRMRMCMCTHGSSPSDGQGDSTAWYASFWAFVSGYLGKRFGKRYCLNPEASLLLHTGNTTVPRQVTCVTVDSGTSKVDLPFDNSLLVYPDKKRVPRTRMEVRGLQVWPVAEALCLVLAVVSQRTNLAARPRFDGWAG